MGRIPCGRNVTGNDMPRARKYANDAERVAAYRARHQLVTLSVDVPAEIVAGIEEYMRFKNLTKAAVIAKLVRTQLLRKR
jgi:hypothetical protein